MKRCALEGAKLNVRNLFRRYEPNICFSGRQKSRIRSEANQAEWGCQSSEGGGNKSTEKKGYWHLTVLLFYQTGSSSILSSSTRPPWYWQGGAAEERLLTVVARLLQKKTFCQMQIFSCNVVQGLVFGGRRKNWRRNRWIGHLEATDRSTNANFSKRTAVKTSSIIKINGTVITWQQNADGISLIFWQIEL